MGKTYFKPVIHVLEVDSEEIIAQSLSATFEQDRAYGKCLSIGDSYETSDGRYKNNNRGRNSIWSDDE